MTIRRLLQLHAEGVERQWLSSGDTARPACGLARQPIHSDGVAVPLDLPPFPDDPAQCDDVTNRDVQGPPVGPVGCLRSHRGPPPAAGPQLAGGRPRVRHRRVRRPPTSALLRQALRTLRSVTSASDHLFQPFGRPSPVDDALLESKVLSASAEDALLQRLYNPKLLRSRSLGVVTPPVPPFKSTVLSSETKDALASPVDDALLESKVLSARAEGALLRRLYNPQRLRSRSPGVVTPPVPPFKSKVLSSKAKDALVKRLHKQSPPVRLCCRHLPPPLPTSKVLKPQAEDLLLKRLYRRPLDAQKLIHRTERTPRLTRRLKVKEQAEFVKKFHEDRVDQVASKTKSLQQKYLPPSARSPKLSRSGVEELNERLYYRLTAAAQKSSAAVPSDAGQPLP